MGKGLEQSTTVADLRQQIAELAARSPELSDEELAEAIQKLGEVAASACAQSVAPEQGVAPGLPIESVKMSHYATAEYGASPEAVAEPAESTPSPESPTTASSVESAVSADRPEVAPQPSEYTDAESVIGQMVKFANRTGLSEEEIVDKLRTRPWKTVLEDAVRQQEELDYVAFAQQVCAGWAEKALDDPAFVASTEQDDDGEYVVWYRSEHVPAGVSPAGGIDSIATPTDISQPRAYGMDSIDQADEPAKAPTRLGPIPRKTLKELRYRSGDTTAESTEAGGTADDTRPARPTRRRRVRTAHGGRRRRPDDPKTPKTSEQPPATPTEITAKVTTPPRERAKQPRGQETITTEETLTNWGLWVRRYGDKVDLFIGHEALDLTEMTKVVFIGLATNTRPMQFSEICRYLAQQEETDYHSKPETSEEKQHNQDVQQTVSRALKQIEDILRTHGLEDNFIKAILPKVNKNKAKHNGRKAKKANSNRQRGSKGQQPADNRRATTYQILGTLTAQEIQDGKVPGFDTQLPETVWSTGSGPSPERPNKPEDRGQ